MYSITTNGYVRLIYRYPGGVGGSQPFGAPALRNGVLYGDTLLGGASTSCGYQCGTIHESTINGHGRLLYTFGKTAGAGYSPFGSMVSYDGLVWGTAQDGGDCCGIVFSIDAANNIRSVYAFKGNARGSGTTGDGFWPQSPLLMVHGTLYGTTSAGGYTDTYGDCGSGGCGIIYSLTPQGTEHVLYAFRGYHDGSSPLGGLTYFGGWLYGTTAEGGGCGGNDPQGCGTIFRISPSGTNYQTLYRFRGGQDGFAPVTSMVALNGSLFGTTENGGGSNQCGQLGCGTIFELTP